MKKFFKKLWSFLRRTGEAVGAYLLEKYEPLFLLCFVLAFGATSGFWTVAFAAGFLITLYVSFFASPRTAVIMSITTISIGMLPVIEAKIEAIRQWQKEAEERVIQQAQLFEPEILEMNTDAQLYDKGVDSMGKPVQPKYTPFTVSLKMLKGQPTGRVTLRDEGDFYESFEILWLRTAFLLTATNWKTQKLVSKYGAAIFGLTTESVGELTDMLREPVLNDLKQTIL